MHKGILYYLLGLSIALVLSGCMIRTYTLTKDRVDQDLSMGNRGYLLGLGPSGGEKERKATRTTQVIEIELRSPAKLKEASKTKPQEVAQMQKIEVAQNIAPETLEPGTLPSFEKYTVQKNDTLQKISKKFYGTTKKWTKIYEANKDTLKGPDKVYVGQVLNIPVEPLKETKENLK